MPDTKTPHIRVIQRRLSVYCTPRASCLTFNGSLHEQLSASSTTKLCQINRVKSVFNQVTLLIIINVLVMSKIDYCNCSVIWSSTSESNIKKIQLLQNFAARIITGRQKLDDLTPVLRELMWLPIKKRLLFKNTLLTFKCLNVLKCFGTSLFM